MLKLALALLACFLLLVSGAEAAYWQDSCTGADDMLSTLYIESNGTVLVNLTNPISCVGLGCNNITGKCNPVVTTIDPYIMLSVVIVLTGLTSIFAFLLHSAKDRWIQLMYLFLTVVFVASDLLTGSVVVVNGGLTSSSAPLNMMFGMLIGVFLFIAIGMGLYMILSSTTDLGQRIVNWYGKAKKR
jgi:hypothetical protein